MRDRTKVPYRVKADITGVGNKRRIAAGDIFVRRGSHVSIADPDALRALEDEAQFSRSH